MWKGNVTDIGAGPEPLGSRRVQMEGMAARKAERVGCEGEMSSCLGQRYAPGLVERGVDGRARAGVRRRKWVRCMVDE